MNYVRLEKNGIGKFPFSPVPSENLLFKFKDNKLYFDSDYDGKFEGKDANNRTCSIMVSHSEGKLATTIESGKETFLIPEEFKGMKDLEIVVRFDSPSYIGKLEVAKKIKNLPTK